jgi:hypothetical protein
MTGKGVVKVVKSAGKSIDPMQLLSTVVSYGRDWMIEEQRGRTERKAIESWRQVQLERIRAQQEVLLKALELTFDERRETFGGLFTALDAALAAGDTSLAASILESITDLAKTSPFKDLQNTELVVAELKRPDKVWDV